MLVVNPRAHAFYRRHRFREVARHGENNRKIRKRFPHRQTDECSPPDHLIHKYRLLRNEAKRYEARWMRNVRLNHACRLWVRSAVTATTAARNAPASVARCASAGAADPPPPRDQATHRQPRSHRRLGLVQHEAHCVTLTVAL
ncbi:hypothetical protein GCM10009753_47040 [Streptantibioticus ferralitis]